MADISSFSALTFDADSWINAAIRDRPDEGSLEAYLTQLAMKLHMVSQDYNDQLESGMSEAMTTMPKIQAEISRIEGSLKNIENEMKSLTAQLKLFDEKNIAGVEDLSRLDTLKTNMEKCRAMLEEHTRWNQVVREAKNFLESHGRLRDTADRIEVMTRSLGILQHMPGHEDRQEVCRSFTEAFLGTVKPKLREDLSGPDIAPLQEYLYVFSKLGRQPEFEEEYIVSKPEAIRSYWQDYEPSSEFSNWFTSFLTRFDEFIVDEVNALALLFGKEQMPRMLSTMIENILASIAPQLCERISANKSPIVALDSFTNATEFAKTTIATLDGCDAHRIFCVLSAIYGGFIIYMDAYPEIESEYLRNACTAIVSKVNFEDSESLLGSNQASRSALISIDPISACMIFGDKLLDAIDTARAPTLSAVKRIVKFMSGLKVKPSVRALTGAITAYIQQLTSKIDELRSVTGHPPEKSSLSSRTSSGNLSTVDQAANSHAQSWAKQLESSDLGGRELIPAALRALQSAGRLSKHLRELELLALDLFNELAPILFKDSAVDRIYRSMANSTGGPSSSQDLAGNVCAVFITQLLQNNPSASLELKSFLSSVTSHHVAQSAFAALSSPLGKFKASCGAMLFDLCCCAPEKLLSDLKSDEIWCSVSSNSSEENLLPQQIFTQVGEHLLSLVQEFEAFAASDALSDLLYLTGEAAVLTTGSSGWRRIRELLELSKEDDGVDSLCKKTSCSLAIASLEKQLFGTVVSVSVDDELSDGSDGNAASNKLPKLGGLSIESIQMNGGKISKDDEDAAIQLFVNDWLGAIADATVGLVMVQLASIPALSLTGCFQLRVDITYLRNVFNAMGLRIHPILEHVYSIVNRDASATLIAIEGLTVRTSSTSALQKLDVKVINAMIRGKK